MIFATQESLYQFQRANEELRKVNWKRIKVGLPFPVSGVIYRGETDEIYALSEDFSTLAGWNAMTLKKSRDVLLPELRMQLPGVGLQLLRITIHSRRRTVQK